MLRYIKIHKGAFFFLFGYVYDEEIITTMARTELVYDETKWSPQERVREEINQNAKNSNYMVPELEKVT